MNSRNWVHFFFSTLLVGAVITSIVGFALKWGEYKELFANGELLQILSVLVWFIGVGFIFSLISQMGFFAYLTVHRFGLGIFKSLWSSIQLVLIAFVLFDLVYFRYQFFAEEGESLIPYLMVAGGIFIFSIIVAYVKKKQTNHKAFVPAIFFMVVVTTVEWFPALRVNEENWLFLMLVPLMVCNAYQLLRLSKITANSKANTKGALTV